MRHIIMSVFVTGITLILGYNSFKAQTPVPLSVVWEDSATDVSGRISRDGKWLSYIDWSTGDLGLREMATGRRLRITKGSGDLSEYAGASVFSPKVERIAYVWNGVNTKEVRVSPIAGGSSSLVSSNLDLLDWSPDGESLLVYKEKQLGYISLKTGAFRSLLNVQNRILQGTISRNGQWVAFTTLSSDPSKDEIKIASTRSGKVRTFVSGGGSHYAPVWSLNGKSITYLSDRGGTPRVWRKSLSDRDPNNGGQPIAVQPDASVSILGIDSNGTTYLGAYDRGGGDVYVGKVDWEKNFVAEVTKIPSPPFRGSRRAVFAPSASSIAFMQTGRGFSVRPGWQTPVVHNLDTKVQLTYPTHLTLRDEPLWARDETALYFVAPTEGTIGEGADQKWSFYRLDLSKGSYVKVGKVETAGLVRMAGTTTDSIIYLLNTYGKTPTGSIFSLDVSSGKTSQLYHIENNNLFDAALSPDRSKIALVINEADGSRGLHVLARGQKTPSFITAIRPNARAQLMWLSSGDAIITSGRIKGNQGIWRIPLDGTQPQSLNMPAADVTEVRVSADGRKIAFTRTNQLPRQILALAASP